MRHYQELYTGEMAKYWEEALLGEMRYFENVLIKKLLKDGLVFDIGCGPGSHTAYISKDQPVVGLDLSPELIRKAKEVCKDQGNYENVNLIRGDMRYLPFRPNSFHNVMIILSSGLFSDEENESLFAEAIKTLKKYGRFIYQEFYYPSSMRPLKWELTYPIAPKGFSITKKRRYDPKTKRMHVIETVENKTSGKKMYFNFKTRLHDIDELKELHNKNGLKIEDIFGHSETDGFNFEIKEFDEKKFDLMTIVSEKNK